MIIVRNVTNRHHHSPTDTGLSKPVKNSNSAPFCFRAGNSLRGRISQCRYEKHYSTIYFLRILVRGAVRVHDYTKRAACLWFTRRFLFINASECVGFENAAFCGPPPPPSPGINPVAFWSSCEGRKLVFPKATRRFLFSPAHEFLEQPRASSKLD